MIRCLQPDRAPASRATKMKRVAEIEHILDAPPASSGFRLCKMAAIPDIVSVLTIYDNMIFLSYANANHHLFQL
jgi:hypothetical protein